MSRTLIIAEAGVNHNGDINLAKELIDVAVSAGADVVKFQSFKLDQLVSKTAKKANYQIENTNESESSQYEMLKKLLLTREEARELKSYCDKKGIQFLSSPFDSVSAQELVNDDLVNCFKVPSGEIINLNYLRTLASFNLPVILSTGMASLVEIGQAIEVLLLGGNLSLDDITVLHCNTQYPTPMEDVNLKAMLTIRDAFKVKVGYSDHTLGIEVPLAAVAMGASVIEKHFTIDKSLAGPDHRASLDPVQLHDMVSGIRNLEKAFGDGVKQPSPSEKPNIEIVRKSLHLTESIPAGVKIEPKHLVSRRPGSGISPMDVEKVLGFALVRPMDEGAMLKWTDLK